MTNVEKTRKLIHDGYYSIIWTENGASNNIEIGRIGEKRLFGIFRNILLVHAFKDYDGLREYLYRQGKATEYAFFRLKGLENLSDIKEVLQNHFNNLLIEEAFKKDTI